MQRGDDAGSHKSRHTTHQPSPLSHADECRLWQFENANMAAFRAAQTTHQHTTKPIERKRVTTLHLRKHIPTCSSGAQRGGTQAAWHVTCKADGISKLTSRTTMHLVIQTLRNIAPLNNTVCQQRWAVGVWAARGRNYVWWQASPTTAPALAARHAASLPMNSNSTSINGSRANVVLSPLSSPHDATVCISRTTAHLSSKWSCARRCEVEGGGSTSSHITAKSSKAADANCV